MQTVPNPTVTTQSLGVFRGSLLVVWALASFGLMYFAQDLQVRVAGSPLSFWLAAQGLVLLFVLLVFVYAIVTNRAEAAQASAQVMSEPLR